MANGAQAEIWENTAAPTWIRYVDEFDATLDPFGAAVIDRLELGAGDSVLDIGCGVGSTSMDLASRVAPGRVVGVDISQRMVTEATRRAADRGVDNVEFTVTDAQTGDFGDTPFDVAFSRVGVMFFEDPTAAFTNIRSALVSGGRLGFVCFQSPMVNPFISLPFLAAVEHLDLSPPGLDGPGPFSLWDPERTREILSSAGFTNIRIDPGPDEAVIPAVGDLTGVARRLLEQNPFTATHIAGLTDEQLTAVTGAVAGVLEPHRQGDQVRMGAGTWVVLAESPLATLSA